MRACPRYQVVSPSKNCPNMPVPAEHPLHHTAACMGVIPSIAPFLSSAQGTLPATAKALSAIRKPTRAAKGLTRSLLESLRSGTLL